ncbi:hypothetical protein LEP1GSC058_2204 [Leptospira fainei serovar Hurstbridge str. BUT 6]|uniref:Uncharacterized protein n=1 Tax=Leptospira fainei serovar Hurstbridge str. BUT 6 TaxID=1193011 RepID=S3V3P0_9LEPT|nr:hypothetical protein LEP1GSC058_2204 [Leptospira fainei serovar Hurstbridge str. BUT 6]
MLLFLAVGRPFVLLRNQSFPELLPVNPFTKPVLRMAELSRNEPT